MSKLTKQQAAQHNAACVLLQKEVLNEEARLFVLDNWQESANHMNSVSGAFFTQLASHAISPLKSPATKSSTSARGSVHLHTLSITTADRQAVPVRKSPASS
jgi:hypothetical protein